MTEAWSGLPNTINMGARGCNDLSFVFSLKCRAGAVKEKERDRKMD